MTRTGAPRGGPVTPEGDLDVSYPVSDVGGAGRLPPRRPAGSGRGRTGRAPGTVSLVPRGCPGARRPVRPHPRRLPPVGAGRPAARRGCAAAARGGLRGP